MSKFANSKPAKTAAIQTVSKTPDTVTYEGGAGFTRTPQSELFLLAVTNMVGESTFYEAAADRDSRFKALIEKVMKIDPSWIARFVPFLRNDMNMRTASLVMAAEYVKAGGPNGRKVVSDALQRADEPAELLGYWLGKYGRKLPKALKRGLADATERLYNERSVLKYDGDNAVRLSDVLEFAHPKPKAEWQEALFGWLIGKRHKRETLDTSKLPTIASHDRVAAFPQDALRLLLATADGVNVLKEGGWTWEALSSKYGKLDAKFWEAMIPEMGIFALVRNLRNFDDAGINAEAKASVIARLSDPEVIAKSRMFPLRFFAAHKNTGTLKWGDALETALNLSLANIPALPGKTLVLVDTSGSMDGPLSDKSKMLRKEAAALFGSAVALRAEKADLVEFGTGSQPVSFRKGDSLLRTTQKFTSMGGTQTVEAILKNYSNHDRIIILTDEQAFAWGAAGATWNAFGIGSESKTGLKKVEEIKVPIYTFNLAGYKAGHLASDDNRYTFGGLTDSGFTAIAMLERGRDAAWPF